MTTWCLYEKLKLETGPNQARLPSPSIWSRFTQGELQSTTILKLLAYDWFSMVLARPVTSSFLKPLKLWYCITTTIINLWICRDRRLQTSYSKWRKSLSTQWYCLSWWSTWRSPASQIEFPLSLLNRHESENCGFYLIPTTRRYHWVGNGNSSTDKAIQICGRSMVNIQSCLYVNLEVNRVLSLNIYLGLRFTRQQSFFHAHLKFAPHLRGTRPLTLLC